MPFLLLSERNWAYKYEIPTKNPVVWRFFLLDKMSSISEILITLHKYINIIFMKNKILSVIFIVAVFFGAKATNDTICITLRPSNQTGTMINTESPNTNYGLTNLFYSATWTCSGPTCLDRGLIQFDLSSIPNNATITNASLSLYADNSATVGYAGEPTYGTNNAAWLQRNTSAWSSGTVTWNNQPTSTTVDEVTLPESTGTSENYTLNVTQLITDIMVSGNNYGFKLLQQNEITPYQSLIFGSSINADSNIRPQLQICYVVNVVSSDTNCISLRPYDTNGTVLGTQNPSNMGTVANLFYSATWTCSGPTCLDRGFIKFNLSSIPSNATISSASLSLYADNSATVGYAGEPTYGTNNAGWLQRITSPWNYNTISWNTQPTTTTLHETTLAESIGTSENYTVNVTQLLRDIITSGVNYGFELLQQNEASPYQSLIFGSSANADSSIRPKLEICYSIPTSIASVTNPNMNIAVYPNPANDEVVFKTSSSEGVKNYHVEMYNIAGQEVRSFQLYPYQVTINTSDLARGIYIYKIVNNDSVLQSGKIILQ